MNVFVDTSVWSLAMRRDAPHDSAQVAALTRALSEGDSVFTTGLVLQELLQGFRGPKQQARIIRAMTALPLLVPDRTDHIEAANLRNTCRRAGIQVTTIDALLAQLCIRHELSMLTADADFEHIARHLPLTLAVPNGH